MKVDRETILGAAIVGAVIVGWFFYDDYQASGAKTRREARAQAVASQLSQPPSVRELPTKLGTLLEISFNTDKDGFGIVEKRTCYVWKDERGQQSVLSCPSDPMQITGSEN